MKKLYIPAGARACNRHEFEDTWDINSIGPIQRFSAKQIEDLINLLRDSALGNNPHKSGCYFCIRICLCRIYPLEFHVSTYTQWTIKYSPFPSSYWTS